MYDTSWEDDWSVDMGIEETKLQRAEQRWRNHCSHIERKIFEKLDAEMRTNDEHQREEMD